MIDYLPQAIINKLNIDYLPYDLLLNDWRKELLKWFNVNKFDISDRLLNIFAKQSMGTYGYVARITFTNVEKGKNRRILTLQNLTYEEERDLLNLSSSSDEE